MRSFTGVLLASAFTAVSIASPAPKFSRDLPLVQSNQLRRVLTRTALLKHAEKLESFADADPQSNRGFGGVGHKLTVDYIYNTLSALDYYDVWLQEFEMLYASGEATFEAEGTTFSSLYFTYAPNSNGPITAELVPVANLGCELSDFPAEVAGKIAFISRGTCDFGLKTALAGASGAVGAIIYNNAPGSVSGGTLASPERPQGPYVPVASISQADGLSLLADIEAGPVTGTLSIESVMENRTTHNVFAQTKIGDQNNVVVTGGHTDSVGAGPGINDDGSGSMGLLEVALQLPKWSVTNAVRFAFWSAEEFGLVGSEVYVNSLSAEEQDKIALYLNFDMIASPNFGYFIYDGDGSAFGTSGPEGSAQIEKLFEDYFEEVGLPSEPTAFTGRSDYGPFLEVGIPSGGLFTGAEGIKTEAQVALWGGKAGEWYDPGYHLATDTLKNLNVGAWIQNLKAAAHAIATYALSTEGIPKRVSLEKRTISSKHTEHNHGSSCGAPILEL